MASKLRLLIDESVTDPIARGIVSLCSGAVYVRSYPTLKGKLDPELAIIANKERRMIVVKRLTRMKSLAIVLFAGLIYAQAPDFAGKWKVSFVGPVANQPMEIPSMVLDLRTDGAKLTGSVQVGRYPGESIIIDVKFDGAKTTLTTLSRPDTVTGRRSTCYLELTEVADKLDVDLSCMRRDGTPPQEHYRYSGTRQ